MMPVDPPAFCLMSFSLPVVRVRVLDDLGIYTKQFETQMISTDFCLYQFAALNSIGYQRMHG
jgi:hypothetical protein